MTPDPLASASTAGLFVPDDTPPRLWPEALEVPVDAVLMSSLHPLDDARLQGGRFGLIRAARPVEIRALDLPPTANAAAAVFRTCERMRVVAFGQPGKRPFFAQSRVGFHFAKLGKLLARQHGLPRQVAESVLAYTLSQTLARVEMGRLIAERPSQRCKGCQCLFGRNGPLQAGSRAAAVASEILGETIARGVPRCPR